MGEVVFTHSTVKGGLACYIVSEDRAEPIK
jgi:hypothetical protein